ncbi:MAG: Hsp33 family molecular chaperone HslO [Pseudomonadota bacterium]
MSAQRIADDLLRPFQLERSSLRGRLVRLGGVLNQILTRHDYPEPVGHLLGELLVLAAALAGGLKFKGTFSLQAQGAGPISLILADYRHDGVMRGYANFDAERVEAGADIGTLLGDGRLMLTVDQGGAGTAYQSIVELNGASLTECKQTYFRQSEQLKTGLKLAVDRVTKGADRQWRGGALMVERLADQPLDDLGDEDREDWHRTMLLLGTATTQELLEPDLPADDLLYRLFHEEGVRVFEPLDLGFGCRCNRDRVETMLQRFSDAEIEDMRQEDGGLIVTCQFCNARYPFDDRQIAALRIRNTH